MNQKPFLFLFCGSSGSGKTYFIENRLSGYVYKLKSLTTRPKREKESNDAYYFCSETDFYTIPKATNLWVNLNFWHQGDTKWLYGVPEFEIQSHIGQHLIYDVIEPRYARQLIDWFLENNLAKEYNIRIAWFLPPPDDTFEIVKERASMKDDLKIRQSNTCFLTNFLDSGLFPDFISCPRDGKIDPKLLKCVEQIKRTHIKQK